MEEHYHYVVHAKIVDGKFAGWFIDYEMTEAKFPDGNKWTPESFFGQRPDMKIDNNLLMDLGSRLYDPSEVTVTPQDNSTIPW